MRRKRWHCSIGGRPSRKTSMQVWDVLIVWRDDGMMDSHEIPPSYHYFIHLFVTDWLHSWRCQMWIHCQVYRVCECKDCNVDLKMSTTPCMTRATSSLLLDWHNLTNWYLNCIWYGCILSIIERYSGDRDFTSFSHETNIHCLNTVTFTINPEYCFRYIQQETSSRLGVSQSERRWEVETRHSTGRVQEDRGHQEWFDHVIWWCECNWRLCDSASSRDNECLTIYILVTATLGEHRLRELNDEINKLLRQKHYWEIRIRELGGTVTSAKQYYDVEGKELPGAHGYKYFGAGKSPATTSLLHLLTHVRVTQPRTCPEWGKYSLKPKKKLMPGRSEGRCPCCWCQWLYRHHVPRLECRVSVMAWQLVQHEVQGLL